MDRTALQSRVTDRMAIEDRGHLSPCWISNRAAYPKGYTKIGYLGSTWLTHRFAYTVFIGDIPEGLQIDHLCRIPACCKPDHLEPVTCRQNLLRGDTITARQVTTTHCPRGHPYDRANTYIRPDGKRKRDCITCRNTRGPRHGISPNA